MWRDISSCVFGGLSGGALAVWQLRMATLVVGSRASHLAEATFDAVEISNNYPMVPSTGNASSNQYDRALSLPVTIASPIRIITMPAA